ncbi:probable protein phosphatase 2C 47 [Asparagus officinalis]|uniref:probable protein phosphatase 2C 47 n=1 Tax=Asparagus officinalis TaxID=4686 RepID=UPI00098E066D|nr:probable protein phosphatase 2C 47 [Asparagus officinalis]
MLVTAERSSALVSFLTIRVLLVANVGDCRAVLCHGGKVINMSHDHRGSVHAAERLRVEKPGGYIDDWYLNGVQSVTRALGNWDMKIPTSATGLPSPLITEPEFRQALITEDDEFLIIGCDGICDVMSGQHVVNVVRRGLRPPKEQREEEAEVEVL